MKPIKIALVGGVCGGKTSAIPFVKQQIESRGYRCYVVPEVATLVGNAGMNIGEAYSKSGRRLQSMFMKLGIQLEDSITEAASIIDKPAVILCDRGVIDGKAFAYPPIWEEILREHKTSNLELKDRYDAAFYMITAADGARAFYGNETNKVRGEDPRRAVEICEKNRMAWLGHPHLRVFDNSTNFATKLSRLCQSVDSYLNSVETERRWLVKSAEIDVPVETVFVEQIYLKSSEDKTERIRKRGQAGAWVFTRTIKDKKVNGSGKEVEKKISELEYDVLKEQADESRRPIYKKRNYFLWENQYFELDEFVDPITGTLILEIELDDINQPVTLPPFIKIDREITSDPQWTNKAIAKVAAATA